MIFKPYGNNILVAPASKNKIIGDTSKFYLYGTVLDVGSKVTDIHIGDTIGYTQWGTNKIIMEDNSEAFFIQDNPDFILGVIHNGKQA